MNGIVEIINWRDGIDQNPDIDAIDHDFVLLDHIGHSKAVDYPFKIDATVATICTKGTSFGKVNLKPYSITAPCLTIILPDQILESGTASEDFEGLVMIMSRRFTDNLNIPANLPMIMSILENPTTVLTEEELQTIVAYFSILQRAVKKKDNPHRMEIVQCLIKAFFYSTNFHNRQNDEKKPKNKVLAENFISIVRTHYREQRGIEFYADKLCLTPKYLSKVIKESSGKSASEWIDDYVVLEAKALLKSTNKTIQQISDELNFPSQSFFGKYFKRLVGMSPKEYKKS